MAKLSGTNQQALVLLVLGVHSKVQATLVYVMFMNTSWCSQKVITNSSVTKKSGLKDALTQFQETISLSTPNRFGHFQLNALLAWSRAAPGLPGRLSQVRRDALAAAALGPHPSHIWRRHHPLTERLATPQSTPGTGRSSRRGWRVI